MTCPVCGEKTTVCNSAADCECVYRMRKCKDCGYKFATTERESNDSEILKQLRSDRKRDKNRKT